MKQGAFIVYDDLSHTSGVINKINNQIAAFINAGYELNPYWMKCKHIKGYKLVFRIPFTNVSPKWEYSEAFDNLDFVYLRRPLFMNYAFVVFLRELKRHNSKLKIIMEIPTYPYDAEILNKKSNIPIYIKDVLARKRIGKYIDRIAILGWEKEVFSIKTVRIINGFNFNRISVKTHSDPNCINLAVVAVFNSWHGYERLVESIGSYYAQGGNRDIHIHFVGDGPSLMEYKQLTEQFALEKRVSFYGIRDNTFLNSIYEKCDIGVCSLGSYKKGIYYSCELKSREYLAAGLPLITGCNLDISSDKEFSPFILEFPNDDTPIDCLRIIEFYDKLYATKSQSDLTSMWNEIRNISMKRFDINTSLNEVFSYIEG